MTLNIRIKNTVLVTEVICYPQFTVGQIGYPVDQIKIFKSSGGRYLNHPGSGACASGRVYLKIVHGRSECHVSGPRCIEMQGQGVGLDIMVMKCTTDYQGDGA